MKRVEMANKMTSLEPDKTCCDECDEDGICNLGLLCGMCATKLDCENYYGENCHKCNEGLCGNCCSVGENDYIGVCWTCE